MSVKTKTKLGRPSVKAQIAAALGCKVKDIWPILDKKLQGVKTTEEARIKLVEATGVIVAYSTFRAFLKKGPIAGKFPKSSPLYRLANLRPGRQAAAGEAATA